MPEEMVSVLPNSGLSQRKVTGNACINSTGTTDLQMAGERYYRGKNIIDHIRPQEELG